MNCVTLVHLLDGPQRLDEGSPIELPTTRTSGSWR